jgi:hypothetical protein
MYWLPLGKYQVKELFGNVVNVFGANAKATTSPVDNRTR